MFPYNGFLPAAQSTQNQASSGVLSTLTHAAWNAAGQDSQHSKVPPNDNDKKLSYYMCCEDPTGRNVPFSLDWTVALEKKKEPVLGRVEVECVIYEEA